MKEEHLELNLEPEKEYTFTLTQSEVNTLSLLLGFVAGDGEVDSLLKKLDRVAEETLVDELYERVIVQQVCVEDGSLILPKGIVCLYDNGYVLKIKD